MPLQQAAQYLNTTYRGPDVLLTGVSTDTRTLAAGDLFVALRGPNFDGHDYIQQAIEKGAVAMMLEQKAQIPIPVVQVENTRQSLGQLAKAWRKQMDVTLVAVTGSNGKTSVKEMLASIFSQQGSVLATQGNLNNDIGVPQTLFRLGAQHEYAVLELGANHVGEIAYLTDIVSPDIAVITNATAAHLEGFGSIQNIAQTKGEIFSSLGIGGTAIINADDEFANLWRGLAQGHQQLSFGLSQSADVGVSQVSVDNSIDIKTPCGTMTVKLPLPGRHNVLNALAATSAALAAKIPLSSIKAGLESVAPIVGRLQIKFGIKNSRIIDDTYNANPASFNVALAVLNRYDGQRFIAMGDMAELGKQSRELHTQVGLQVRDAGVQRLYTVGDLAQLASEAFGKGAQHFPTQSDMITALHKDLDKHTTLLIKGSRCMHMEKVVQALSLPAEK